MTICGGDRRRLEETGVVSGQLIRLCQMTHTQTHTCKNILTKQQSVINVLSHDTDTNYMNSQTHDVPSLRVLTQTLSDHGSLLSAAHKQASSFSAACLGTGKDYRCESEEDSLRRPAGALPTRTRVRDMTERTRAAFGASSSGLTPGLGLLPEQLEYSDCSLSHLCKNFKTYHRDGARENC